MNSRRGDGVEAMSSSHSESHSGLQQGEGTREEREEVAMQTESLHMAERRSTLSRLYIPSVFSFVNSPQK